MTTMNIASMLLAFFSEAVTKLIHLGGLEVHISIPSTIPMALTLQVLFS